MSFVAIYDTLQDNFRSGNEQDSLSFIEEGKTCSAGNFIQLRKALLITQHGSELKFKESKLKVSPSSGFSRASQYQFIETNDFPKALKFEKSGGYRPVNWKHTGTDGVKQERTSKYDSSEVFGKVHE